MTGMCLECLKGAGNLKKKTKYLTQRNQNLDFIYVDPLEERKKWQSAIVFSCLLIRVNSRSHNSSYL